MKITTFIFSLFALAITAFAQQPTTAIAADGQKFLLYPDGTWRLLKSASGKLNPAGTYQKPTDAELFVKAPRGLFGIWIQQQKWKQDTSSEEDVMKISFNHKKGDAYAMMIAERISIPFDTLKKMALANAKEAAPDAKIAFEENRTVNGKKVLCLMIEGTINSINFIYYGLYYSGTEGTFQVLTYTSKGLFNEYKTDFDDFLNGTQIGAVAQ